MQPIREETADLGGADPGGLIVDTPTDRILLLDRSLTLRQRALIVAQLLDDDEFDEYVRANWAVKAHAPSKGAQVAATLAGVVAATCTPQKVAVR